MDNKFKIEKRVKLYPKIYRQDNMKRELLGIDWTKRVIIEEKFDGSNIGLVKVNNEFVVYSRNGLINFEKNKSFSGLKDRINSEWLDDMDEGDILFGEFIGIAKLPYNKTHKCLKLFEYKTHKTNTYSPFYKKNIKVGIFNRNEIVELVNSEKQLSEIDGITPIEGVVVKQLDEKGNIIAREKIVSSRFLKEKNVRYKKKKNRFSKEDIAKYKLQLIELGKIDIDETDSKKIKTIMLDKKESSKFCDDYFMENDKKEMKKIQKAIIRDFNYKIRESFETEETNLKNTKNRFTFEYIKNYRKYLIENKIIDPDNMENQKIKILMFKNSSNFSKNYIDINLYNEIIKIKKEIYRDLKFAVKEFVK